MKNKIIISTALLLVIVINNSAHSVSQSKNSYQSLKETIKALNITKKKSESKLFSLKQDNNPLLYKDYSIFINYLKFRIKENCIKINDLYGESELTDLPCPFNIRQYKKLDTNKYLTDDENVQSLDDELMTALGDFDEMLLKENDNVAQFSKKIKSSGENQVESKNNGSIESDEENSSSNDISKNTDSTKGANTKEKNESIIKKQSKNAKTGSKKYNQKKINAIDDDIVARQLKEAAENESDVELKEKLWQEYYKYKKKMVK